MNFPVFKNGCCFNNFLTPHLMIGCNHVGNNCFVGGSDCKKGFVTEPKIYCAKV